MKCRANRSVQRREYNKRKNETTDSALAFCSHANFLTLVDIFDWSIDRCDDANREMNRQFQQILRNNMSLRDYGTILHDDYDYKPQKLRASLIKPENITEGKVEPADLWLTQLTQICYEQYITVAIVVLRDKFGWGASMCDKYQSSMNKWLTRYVQGKETLQSMNDKLNERGIDLTCGSANDRRAQA